MPPWETGVRTLRGAPPILPAVLNCSWILFGLYLAPLALFFGGLGYVLVLVGHLIPFSLVNGDSRDPDLLIATPIRGGLEQVSGDDLAWQRGRSGRWGARG